MEKAEVVEKVLEMFWFSTESVTAVLPPPLHPVPQMSLWFDFPLQKDFG